MYKGARFQLVDLTSGEVLFDQVSKRLVNPSGNVPAPGVKVYRGERLLLRADYGEGWVAVTQFTSGWVQLEPIEQRLRRQERIMSANAMCDFVMVSQAALDVLSDADTFRFLALLTALHVKTGTLTGIGSVTEFAEVLGMSVSNASPVLDRLVQAGLVAWHGNKLKVTGGVLSRRTGNSMVVFRHGMQNLMRSTTTTKHGYLGRLFKHVSPGAYGMVQPPTPDTKARRYRETVTVNGLPLLFRDADKWTVAPTVAFLGPSQAWHNALNHLVRVTKSDPDTSTEGNAA